MSTEDSWHFTRLCAYCGCTWGGLHCPHDGVQNPCPSCGKTPVRIPFECDCEFDYPTEESLFANIRAWREMAQLLLRVSVGPEEA